MSIGGFITFYTYFDSSEESYSLYLSYIYDSFELNSNSILVSKTSNYDYYGELIEIKEESTNIASSNETNIFVLYGNYDTDSLQHSVLGKLYHISKEKAETVIFEEIEIKTNKNNNNNNNNNSTRNTVIRFESDEHQLFYKCTGANVIDTIESKSKIEISSDVMIAWTDWGYDIYGKFVNFDIVLNETHQNHSNPYYYSTTRSLGPRTTSGYFTTSKPKEPAKSDGL